MRLSIYKNGEALKAFKGDCRPVNIYKGNIKVVGWEYSELSGESFSVANTYNDSAYLKINGKSVQDGTPSPDNPIPISCGGNFDLVSCARNLFDIENVTGNYTTYKTGFIFKKGHTYTISAIPLTDSAAVWFFASTQDALYTGTILFRATPIGSLQIANYYATEDTYLMLCVSGKPNDWQWDQFRNEMYFREIQILEGIYTAETLPDYSPYIGNSINFQYPLRSLPDGTKDHIEIDNIAKTANLYQTVGEKILDGTENWSFREELLGEYTGFYFAE
ncbi:MAG: hypothetical protein BWY15_01197 [Firmicutes bacterium ADurb.Bin193]|nr:MAG: hypothetical protein BWY15_01197 [Firmicutes bacterium ADurb.Bin193]